MSKTRNIELLNMLIKQGQVFTRDNSCNLNTYGSPDSLKPEYITWLKRSESLLRELFEEDSPQMISFMAACKIRVFRDDPNKFLQQRNGILIILQTAIETIQNDVFGELTTAKKTEHKVFTNEIFIVHGHDEKLKNETEVFLKELGLEPLVLHRKPDEGLTVIEKFEKHSNVGYAFILLTPDEVSYLVTDEIKKDTERLKERRARPNVVFEFGYFIGKLGRSKVCCLYKDGVTLPSDINGIIYKKVNNSIEDVGFSIMKDLKAAGYSITI